MVANLPMYDWPETRAETDALWARMRAALRGAGIDAPEALDRSAGYAAMWRRRDLVLGEICGGPFARGAAGDAQVIGTMRLALPGCAPGSYCSYIVARADDPAEPGSVAGRRLACNDTGSESGFGALRIWRDRGRLERIVTGSHRASILAVAEGRADLAAIDARTWQIAELHEPALRGLRVEGRTPPVPAPLYITRAGADVAAYRRALGAFITQRPRADYAVLA